MKLTMRFEAATVAIICFLTASPLLAHGQTKGSLFGIIEKLNTTDYRMTALDKALMDVNIQEAYSCDTNIIGSPVIWNPIISKFQTHYYVAPNSSLLKMSSKEQLMHFETKINGIRMALVPALTGVQVMGGGVKAGELFSEIGKLLEVQFVTNEGNQFYVIARYKDGKLQLVREKMNTSQ